MGHPALPALVAARDLAESRRVLVAHPGLLDPAVDAELVDRLAAARAAGDLMAAHGLERTRGLLRRCREVGVEAAFHELTEGAAERFVALLATAEEADEVYSRTDDVTALNRMAEAHGYLVDHRGTIAADPSTRAGIFNNAAVAFLRRWEHLGGASAGADLHRAVELALAASNLADRGSREELIALDNYGRALHRRFRVSGDRRDLDTAIWAHGRVTGVPRDAVPDWVRVANDLAGELIDRYELTGDGADLDRAITVYLAVVESVPPQTRPDAGTVQRLGSALRTRFLRTNDARDIDAAVATHRTALAVAPASWTRLDGLLSSLGASLAVRFRHTGNLGDLAEAVTVLRRAATEGPPGRAEPIVCLNLATGLQMWYEATGDDEDLDVAVDALRDAVAGVAEGDRERAALLGGLGGLLCDRFERQGIPSILDEAVTAHRTALAATPPGSAAYPDLSNGYGRTLYTLHRRTGDPRDLDAAVDAYRGALDAAGDMPGRARYLANLGAALSTRAALTGDLAGLDAAVDTLSAALAATPSRAPDRVDRLENLANALAGRTRRGREADLDRAIAAYDEAAALRAMGSPKRPVTLLNLGNARRHRYEVAGDAADLDRAVAAHRESLSALDQASPRYAVALGALAGDLLLRFGARGTGTDLTEAVRLAEAALAATPADAVDRAGIEARLGTALWTWFAGTRDEAAAEAAARHCRAAARRGLDVQPEAAVISGFAWSQMAGRHARWDEAAEAGELALRGLEALVRSQLTRTHMESWLTAMGSVAAEAAYAHAIRGHGDGGVLALERGRSLLLTEVIERDRGIRDVAALGRADLSERFRAAVDRLQRLQPVPPHAVRPTTVAATTDRGGTA